ncbi:hypothetical protein M5U04_20885 [Xenorhabdus sp. XENO-1]|uniref:hypothetical protein n=1 Tax=Xenorhabdus bovienii TaxID=40576 RepID=UPI0020CA4540|nr:hypothetical protein [Xenorhabdus bovienii]MCP9270455.1 hypothetical protein [Xenorhabdus bovienii subsp. africana]
MTKSQIKFAMLCANDDKKKYDSYREELKIGEMSQELRRLTIELCLMYRRHYRSWLNDIPLYLRNSHGY